jgi:hypothetical protein
MAMVEKKRFLHLESLIAYLQTERDGDEIFIKYKGEKIAPVEEKFFQMTDEPYRLGIEIELDKSEKWVELELWDYDHLTPNDSLGKFNLLVDQASENFTATLRKEGSDARYVLNWSVIERKVKKNKSTPSSGK